MNLLYKKAARQSSNRLTPIFCFCATHNKNPHAAWQARKDMTGSCWSICGVLIFKNDSLQMHQTKYQNITV